MAGRIAASPLFSALRTASRPPGSKRSDPFSSSWTRNSTIFTCPFARAICTTRIRRADGRTLQTNREEEVPEHDHDDQVAQEKEKQIRTPWHRQGSDMPPVSRPRSAGAMTKGKLLTTPSRLLKLIIPLTTIDNNIDRKTVEPLALLVHPQQPLSYLERLIQSELPAIKTANGEDKIPSVHFRAEDSADGDSLEPPNRTRARDEDEDDGDRDEDHKNDDDGSGLESTKFDGKTEKTGVLNPSSKNKQTEAQAQAQDQSQNQEKTQRESLLRGGPGEGGVESYSGSGREGSSKSHTPRFVRWSSSTEIGDFIRDAARGKEFAVEIEGAKDEIRVGVPSFNDRTFYLRQRLRRVARKISAMAKTKSECDVQAQAVAQRIAVGGFVAMLSWWAGVYYLTFETDLGWDTMEPVTYLVGLSGLMCGYLWFLYHNREVSYRAAMNLTVSRRQHKLYSLRGFNLQHWEDLVKEGNTLRSEIKAVAREYDVEWDESKDEQDEAVTKALKKERKEREGGKKEKKDDGDDDDD